MSAPRRPWARLAALAGFIVLSGLVAWLIGVRPESFTPWRVREWVLGFGWWAPVTYLAVYAQPVIPLSASIMTIAGGLAFGPLWGTLAAIFGAWSRACGQYLISRKLGREAVARLLHGNVARFDRSVARHGFSTVLLTRLIPNIPYDMQNYAFGCSPVPFGTYALATLIGIVPASVMYVYLGYSLTDAAQLWKFGIAVSCVAAMVVFQQWFRHRHPDIAGPSESRDH